jgi:DNA-binding LacI/PurR family transcriptional regulator
LRDVAREANVSVSAASLALNGKPGVAAQTRSAVWEAANRLGYRPDERARNLRLGQQSDVALIVDPALTADVGEVSRLFALRLMSTLTSILRQRGRRVFPVSGGADCSTCGVVLVIGASPWFEQLREDLPDVPFVVTGSTGPDPRVAAVLLHDHSAYVAEVLEHLRANGARHIALLRETEGGNYQDEVTEFISMGAHDRGLGLSVYPTRIRASDTEVAARAALRDGADAIVSLLPFPGAILNGLSGRRTPEDVLVVVRGEGLLESQTEPPVTALSMCGEASAQLLADTVEAVLSGGFGIHRNLPHRLIIRRSSSREVSIV